MVIICYHPLWHIIGGVFYGLEYFHKIPNTSGSYVRVLYSMELWLLLKAGPTDSGYVAVLSGGVIFVYMCRTLLSVWKARREQPVDLEKKE